ncbi:MAG: TonB C-terminal domain-containing protein [Myxococcales bacterium]|nr:TonB C-terminal domain-containing protein [Myxococcales bacterium]
MRPSESPRSSPGTLWVMGVAATALLHGGIIGGVLFTQSRAGAQPVLLSPGQVVDVQAVKFGKPRDLSFLPHKEAVHVNKGPRPKLALTENDQALPKLKDADKPPDEEDPLKRTHAAEFKNLTEHQELAEQAGSEDVGDPNGVRGGTATVGKGPLQLQKLQAAVQNAWTVSTTIPDAVLANLKAVASIRMGEDGKIGDIAIVEPSGNDRFDATLLDALGKVKESWEEAPTPDVKQLLTDDGIIRMRFSFQKTR